MFWSRPDVYTRCMDHDPLPSSEEEEDDEDGGGGDDGDDDNEDAAERTDDNEWVASSDEEDDKKNDKSSDEDEDEESEAHSDRYYRYQVGDKVDAFWERGRITVASWMTAVIVQMDDNSDLYRIVWDFNGKRVS